MSTRKVILTTALALAALALGSVPASARTTRELTGTFGHFDEAYGIAVDLETGNVYVADNRTDTVDIFSATGGPPVGGVPSQITGLFLEKDSPQGVAIDNSCYEHEPRLTGAACEEYDPSYGDVYVVDEGHRGSSQEGAQEGIEKFKLNPGSGYELVVDLAGGFYSDVTVDSHGNVYADGIFKENVIEFKKVVAKILNGGKEEIDEKVEKVEVPEHITLDYGPYGPAYVASDDLGNIYLGSMSASGDVARLAVTAAGEVSSEEAFAGFIGGIDRPVAVDRATNNVYVGDGSEVAQYNSAGGPQLTFGSTEPLGGSLGGGANAVTALAVNSERGSIYVVNPLHEDVDVFGSVVGPPVIAAQQPPASSISRTSALIAGTVNPESGSATYRFEYVDAAEYEPGVAEPYRRGGRTATDPLPGGRVPETIERIVLTGLRPGRTYHYRMVASNAAETVDGPDETFTTAAATPPGASTGAASEVSATGVTLAGVIAPRGLPTSYVFEVGTDTTYGGAKLFGNAGSGTGEVPVSVGLQYLVPGTTYHYRLVATSFDGTTAGQDGTFTTPVIPSPLGQPPSTPLIASPSVQFPSVAGAITEPLHAAKTKKKSKGTHAKRGSRKRTEKARPKRESAKQR
jgi:hypothetical protein